MASFKFPILYTYFQTGPPSALPAFRTRCDEYMSQHHPHLRWCSTSPEDLKAYLKMMGATDDNLQECLERYNKGWDELFACSPNGGVVLVGVKPKLGEIEQVLYFPIPDSKFAIRIWPGGMQHYEQYCLDFFDIKKCIPVNTPDGFELWDVPRPGVYSFGGKHLSWEAAFGMPNVPPGEEKYSVPEGSRIALKRPGEVPFCFEIPSRVPFAQPQATLPLY